MTKLTANSVSVGEGQGSIHFLLDNTPPPDHTRVRRLWNKNKQHLPNQPSAAHTNLSNTFCKLMMSKDCDILHPRGKPTGYHQYAVPNLYCKFLLLLATIQRQQLDLH